MYTMTLATARQDYLSFLTGGSPYAFTLENSTYATEAHPVQFNKIYRGENTGLVLKLRVQQTLPLFGGELPASARSAPDRNGPTLLFLEFTELFTQEELGAIVVDRIAVDGVSKPFQDAGWKYRAFPAENRLGLCPGSDVTLSDGQTVEFHFAGVRCHKPESGPFRLKILYSNLGGRTDANLGSWLIEPLLVSDAPDTRNYIDKNLTVSLISPDAPGERAQAWITSAAYCEAIGWLNNELILNLAHTQQPDTRASLDLRGAHFTIGFVCGDETQKAALTTVEESRAIGHTVEESFWSVRNVDKPEEARRWVFTSEQTMPPDSIQSLKFNNIHIGHQFEEGQAIGYLMFDHLKGFLDDWFPLILFRSNPTPAIELLNAPVTDVAYGTEVKLSWSSFAVPCVGLAYHTVDDTGQNQPVNKLVPASATDYSVGPIRNAITYILSGYNSPADFNNNSTLPGLDSRRVPVPVTHKAPTIAAFTAICNRQNAHLQWDVAFEEILAHLELYADVDHNSATLDPVHLKGAMVLKNRDFKETPVLTLYADNNLDSTKKAQRDATVDIVKSVTFTPDSPFVLGKPERLLVEYEVECSNIAGTTMEFYATAEGEQLQSSTDHQTVFPMESGVHKKTVVLNASNTFASEQNPPWVKFGRKASGSSLDHYVGQNAIYKPETVEEYLARKKSCVSCYRCNVNGEDYWFNECDYIAFFWDSGQLKAKYLMDLGAKGSHGSWEFTSPVRFTGQNTLILNGPGDEQHFRCGTETAAGQAFDNGDFRVRNGSADAVFTLKPGGLELASRPWQVSWKSDSWSYYWNAYIPYNQDQQPSSFFRWFT